MKKLITAIGLVLATGIFVLSSCSKPDDNNGEPGGNDPLPIPEFKAKVDGVDFVAMEKVATIDQNNILFIGGLDSKDAAISIAISNFEGEKTYDFNITNQNGAGYISDTSNAFYSYTTFGENGSGNVIITGWNASDSIINGTFSFVAEHFNNGETVTVTDGIFNHLQVVFEADNSNHFSAKINGVNWSQSGSNVNGNEDANHISITAFNPFDQTSFSVLLPSNITGGIYNFSPPDYSIAYFENGSIYHVVNGGSINITLHDQVNDRIEATFEFEGWESGVQKIVTDGSFKVDY